MRSFAVLLNPAAGGGDAARGAAAVVARLEQAGAAVRMLPSPGPERLAPLVSEAAERGEVVVSAGGDGMLSHVVGPAARAGATLGLLPAGRGNDFARMLGLSSEPDAVATTLLEAPAHPVDLLACTRPEVGTEIVAGSVYCGIDAHASALVHRMRRTPAPLQYPSAAVRAIVGYAPGRFRLELDDDVLEIEAGMVALANSGYYGQGMRIAPDASLHDGLLDVVVVAATSRLTLLRAFPTIYSGRHVDRPEVSLHRARRVRLTVAARSPVAVGADGEPRGVLPGPDDDPLVVEVLPDAVRVVGG
ncbi:diacylglycerol kinase family lipid kinase [Nocardioides sp. TRM66260-LWL]|uniref:diacylglycerol/lipid kinase family protein n=1 Tax=Nocardioides sp. TRM66260-LWL TaxID=2874478 RepID=UPI001CC80864|nr:diacylglycerol kinase family protein [Nocardioides sp. TRM66260-LWL]MBZ5735455.1 diacylglycerol kinase family lipid kinase [Nocardioides sp. TRM66260-LWL]